MKLEAWQRGIDLFVMAFHLSKDVSDLKLKSQFRDAAQSVSANIAEGYGRRSLPEYLQFLYIAKWLSCRNTYPRNWIAKRQTHFKR